MTLYIIRHADPDYENNTITEFGWQEARALADWMKDIPIDRIYTSPMGRAIDTAKPLCEAKGIVPEILPWTAESKDYLSALQLTPEMDCRYHYSTRKGIYRFDDFTDTDRMKTVKYMIQKSDEFLASFGYVRQGLLYRIEKPSDESVAVFCHGGFGAAWIAHLIGAAPGLAHPSIKLGTSSVTTFSFLNTEKGFNRPVMRRMGEIHHIYKAGLRVNTR